MKLLIFFLLFTSTSYGKQVLQGPKYEHQIGTLNFKSSIKVKWLKTIIDEKNFKYVVKSEIYPEDPNTMFLTMRGGGITIVDVTNPASPKVIQRWNRVGLDMEGQDRLGNIFITIARRGELFVFRVSEKRTIYQIGRLKLPTIDVQRPILFAIPALHTRIYKKGNHAYALITCPWSKRLLIVDITIPSKPKYISGVNTGVKGIEAIHIHKDHAYVGGYRSHLVRSYNISDPNNPKLVQSKYNHDFLQMVPEMSKDYPNTLFMALWGDPGGVVALDLTSPNKFKISDMMLHDSMEKANRVKIKNDLILLPLEQAVGGIGIVKVKKNPIKLVKQLTIRNIPYVRKPYTLNFKGDYIYLFGSETNSMAILKFTNY
jgi:hypothetical protein